MSILIDANTRVLVQGITGKVGSFHTQNCLDYGTKIVAGVTPGKGGQTLEFTNHKVPIFNTIEDAVQAEQPNASLIFVPPAFSKDAILEAVEAEIPLIVCITEWIPIQDMMIVKQRLSTSKSRLIGPNCPGVLTPGQCKMGIMPGYIHLPGNVGIISRSGTLTYEAVWQLTQRNMGQSTCVGIGGDPIIGSSHLDIVKLFNEDPETHAIILIGEIGGNSEEVAAAYINQYVKKPVVGFIAGTSAPEGKRMGHAGAIAGGTEGKAESKLKALHAAGIHIAPTVSDIAETLRQLL